MAVRKGDRAKSVVEEVETTPRATRKKVSASGENHRDPEETQAKVAAARNRVAAAKARKAQSEPTREDLPPAGSVAKADVLEMLGDSVQRLHDRSEEAQRRLAILEDKWSGLEERLEVRLEPTHHRQTEVEKQLAHQSQELLDQRTQIEALNRRLSEQYSNLQREIQSLLERPAVQEVVKPDPRAIQEAEHWMQRCVELEAQQMHYLQTLEAKESEIQDLTLQLSVLQSGVESHSVELKLKDEELNSVRISLQHREHQIHDFEEALKSREEELSELSSYVEELETRQSELEAAVQEAEERSQESAAAQGEELSSLRQELASRDEVVQSLEDSLLAAREEVARLQNQSELVQEADQLRKTLETVRLDYEDLKLLHKDLRDEHLAQTTSLNDERLQLTRGLEQARHQLNSLSERYGKQVDSNEKLVRQLALNDTLLDEAEVVLDALPPPPPSLAIPVRRLRQKISEIRANRSVIEGNDFKSYEERINDLQDELVQTRHKLLEAHTEIDALERIHQRDEARVSELEKQVKKLQEELNAY